MATMQLSPLYQQFGAQEWLKKYEGSSEEEGGKERGGIQQFVPEYGLEPGNEIKKPRGEGGTEQQAGREGGREGPSGVGVEPKRSSSSMYE